MPPDTAAIYERAGMNNRMGYGDSPALVVVDLQRAFTDPESPLGGDLATVVERTNTLLDAAHGADVPVVFTRIVTKHDDMRDLGVWGEKIPSMERLRAGAECVELDPRLETAEGDHVLDKRQASAFHETELDSMLNYLGVDTVLVAGATTSGCIRATAVDACSHGFYTVVPEEAVGDRVNEPHEANLFDIDAKYGDVRPVEEVIDYLGREAKRDPRRPTTESSLVGLPDGSRPGRRWRAFRQRPARPAIHRSLRKFLWCQSGLSHRT